MTRPAHHRRRRLAALLLACAAAAPLVGCATNAATGRSQLNFLSREQEIAMGAEAAPALTQEYGGTVPSADLQAYVTRVGLSMVPYTEADYPSLPWEFTFLDSPVINAFALPGGKVFLSRGLAEKLPSEAAMAAVIGHEIGHVTAEHGDKRISSTMIAQGLIVGGAVAVGATGGAELGQLAEQVFGGVGSGFLLKFSRDEELEADALGMRYMVRAGYDPIGALEVQQTLRDATEGAERPPEFLSTHPYAETRIARIKAALESPTFAQYRNSPDHQRHEARYAQQMLEPLRRLPPPKQPAGQAGAFDLANPASWCGVCRAHAEQAAADRAEPVASR